MSTSGFSDGLIASTPMILLLALAIDWLIGDARPVFKFIPHPIVVIGRLIAQLDKRLNKKGRGPRALIARGLVVALFVPSLAALIGIGIEKATALISKGWIFESLLVAVLIAQRSLAGRCADVGKALAVPDLAKARAGLRHLVGRNPENLDKHAVARAAVESLSENFSDAVIAPVFWFLLLGLPGVLAYKAVNTLDSMIGYKNERYKDFGMAAARFDDLANWIPARLSGGLIALSSVFAPGAHPAHAISGMLRFAKKHESPNAGWPEAAMAGALGLALGGPRDYPGGRRVGVWIGDGRARLEAADIKRALFLYYIACFILALGALSLSASLI